jgi:hypothetical protein
MLVEHLCRYFNKGLTITCNERDIVQVALECLLLLLNAWNLCPVPGTNISHISSWSAASLLSLLIILWVNIGSSHPLQPPSKVTPKILPSNSACAAKLQSCSSLSSASGTVILSTLVTPTHVCICWAILSLHAMLHCWMPPKAMLASWSISSPVHGVSSSPSKASPCAIEHCLKPSRKEKNHALDLTPYPFELIPFEPIDGTDNWYGQLYKPIGANPCKESSLKGFNPPTLFCDPQNFINVGDYKDFQWSTLAELNNKLDPFPWHNKDEHCHYMCNDVPFAPPALYTGPMPSPPATNSSTNMPPTITTLCPRIINSVDTLFFNTH